MLHLPREKLDRYDDPVEPLFHDKPPSEAHKRSEGLFRQPNPAMSKMSRKELLVAMRELMDKGGLRHPIAGEIKAVAGSPVPGEWVIAPGSSEDHRVLYLHGGAFTMGSPRSHRLMAHHFSEQTGACVFLPDYRLMPEHSRMAPVRDAQRAYRWILGNGPTGLNPVKKLIVAGDSAGGNLTLMVLAWARDRRLRQADAAVALSPSCDSTMASPSIRRNLKTDVMLAPMMAPLSKIKRGVLIPGMALHMKVNPYNPLISPIYGNLAGLPPLLIQASASETLEDDARRYANKARLAGSPVTLQMWANMLHVWQSFAPEVPEAVAAFEQIGEFLRDAAGLREASAA